MELLRVEDLHVSFPTEDGVVHAVRGMDFSIEPGETVGIVGESGSGKSVSTQSILQLVPDAAVKGRALFDGRDLLTMSVRELRAVRGARIGMVFQDPLSSLHPQYRIGWQIAEAVRAHRRCSATEARRTAIDLLEQVGLPAPERRVDDYPHQFSGGMRQRVMLAMAVALRPALLIADEPTTALDVTIQAQIIDLIARLQHEYGTAVLLITHDLGVVAEVADRVVTMYAGRVVETAPVLDVFDRPHHPYTQGLLECMPGASTRGRALVPIAGQPPSMLHEPSGCAFAPRCRHALPSCTTTAPPVQHLSPDHRSECVLPMNTAGREIRPIVVTVDAPASRVDIGEAVRPLVRLTSVTRQFVGPRTGLRGGRRLVNAVDGVDLEVKPGTTFGIVGESGSGKSTLARMITGLIPPTSGRVEIDGVDLASLDRSATNRMRRDVQMIFQDPYGSLNPRRRVGSIIADPLVIHGANPSTIRPTVQSLMERVGLNPEHYNRFPNEFSGGQRQRIGIARALALQPRLIVCDEPVSALDISIQAQIVNLLQQLQTELNLTFVVIAHDLGVVQHIADRVAVMYLGRIVEIADTDELFAAPRHPYTKALLAAAPAGHPSANGQRQLLQGDLPSPSDHPSGCRFHPRCQSRQDDCTRAEPDLLTVLGDPATRRAACFHPLVASAADAVVVER